MTINKALKLGISQLRKAGVDSPELDAELFLLRAFHSPIRANWRMNRSWLFAHPEKILKSKTVGQYKKLIARRARREPVAYILGRKEFYGLDFLVDRRVLIPRPESELLVEQAIHRIMNYESPYQSKLGTGQAGITDTVVVDVGVGSGAIIISIAKTCNLKPVTYFATDILPAALRVARKNARRHGVQKKIKFLRGNLLEPIISVILNRAKRNEEPVSRLSKESRASQELQDSSPAAQNDRWVVVANLPYLPTAEWRATQPEIKKWEPREALDGGRDGLRYYRAMFKQLKELVSVTLSQPVSLGGVVLRPINETAGRHRYGQRNPYRRTTPIIVLCEMCPHQVRPFKKMVRGYFKRARFKVVKDLTGRARVVKVSI